MTHYDNFILCSLCPDTLRPPYVQREDEIRARETVKDDIAKGNVAMQKVVTGAGWDLDMYLKF